MKKIPLILITTAVLGVSVFASYFAYQKFVKGPKDLCSQFPKIKGEVSCQDAREIVLAKYPGEIKSVEKTNIPVWVSKPPEGEQVQKDVWLVGININQSEALRLIGLATSSESIIKIEIAVDRQTKGILFYRNAI